MGNRKIKRKKVKKEKRLVVRREEENNNRQFSARGQKQRSTANVLSVQKQSHRQDTTNLEYIFQATLYSNTIQIDA